MNNIKAGADIHADDGGYSEGTRESYEAFVKARNRSKLSQGEVVMQNQGYFIKRKRFPIVSDYSEIVSTFDNHQQAREALAFLESIQPDSCSEDYDEFEQYLYFIEAV